MDEEQFLGIASPQERALYERLPVGAREQFLSTLPVAPRSTIATPEFQQYLTGQGDDARGRFEALSPEAQEEAARLILQRSNQPTEYAGVGGQYGFEDIPFLTSAGSDAGFGLLDPESIHGQSSQEAMQAFRRSQLSALEDSVGEIAEQVTGQPARASVDIGEARCSPDTRRRVPAGP